MSGDALLPRSIILPRRIHLPLDDVVRRLDKLPGVIHLFDQLHLPGLSILPGLRLVRRIAVVRRDGILFWHRLLSVEPELSEFLDVLRVLVVPGNADLSRRGLVPDNTAAGPLQRGVFGRGRQ